MKNFENWFLRIADSDLNWIGLGWLRPAKLDHIGPRYIILSSFVLGLPGMLAGATLIFLTLGRLSTTALLSLVALVMLIEVPLHILFAHFWNRRAERLAREGIQASRPLSPLKTG